MTLISKNWWKQAKLRWQLKSPDFFRKLRIVAVWVFSVACLAEGGILYVESKYADFNIPDLVKYIISFIVGSGLTGGLVSKLAVHKPEDHGIDQPKPPGT